MSNSHHVIGKIVARKPVNNRNPQYPSQDFLLEVEDGSRKKNITFTATKKAIEYLEKFKDGDLVEVHFSLDAYIAKKGKMEGKWINTWGHRAWKVIEAIVEEDYTPPQDAPLPTEPPPPQDEDDLPF